MATVPTASQTRSGSGPGGEAEQFAHQQLGKWKKENSDDALRFSLITPHIIFDR